MKTIKRRTTSADAQAPFDGLHPVLARIFAARQVLSQEELDYSLKKCLPYHQLKDIETAATFLADAIRLQKRLMVIGDFDADGATSTSLAVSALKAFGAKHVNFLVPNRFEYGYGLTPEIVEVANQWQPDVIITVDNGIASITGVEKANSLGIDVVITDHHLPGDELPKAVAIVNPNQHGCPFPSKHLAGVGVIFYVMAATRKALDLQTVSMAQFLDLVALGTVADVVALDYNNRLLVKQGLQRIRAGACRPGITALIQVAKRQVATICASDLAFAVAPRLNAAGRLDDMSLGINCLLSDNADVALTLAMQLDQLNHERRSIEQDMQKQALNDLKKVQLTEKSIPKGICLFDPGWHQGVIGIIAGRIKEQFHRPVIAFAEVDEHEIKGSARSIPGIHIRDVLDVIATRHPELINKFGGHAMAAGLSIPKSGFESFKHIFQTVIEQHSEDADFEGQILSDGDLTPDQFSLELAEIIRQSGPWGQAFPEPIFDGVFNLYEQRLVGGHHLKCILQHPETGRLIDAIAFNVKLDQWPNHHARQVQVAFKLDVNEFRGSKTVQLIIEQLAAV